MAYTKAQLEAIKNTLLASNQPILANQHREQIQSMIDEMYDAQSRADILVGVQADTITGGSDTFIVFRNGEAYQIPLSLLSANTLANLGDVFISNVADGETLVYNAVAERWENQNIFLGFALSNLEDVQLTSLANGDILRYNSTSEKWENTSLATILSPYALLTDLNAYQLLSQKGQANGYAQLDTGAKLPISIIPDSVLGQVEYQGTWNAATNTPTLPATPLKKGDYYVVSADGTQFGIDFLVGDWIISNGTIWEKVDNTDAVTSVFGRLGNIVANASDYSAFYVTLDTTQTITGAKTFSLDSSFNGVSVGRGGGNSGSNTALGLGCLSVNTSGLFNTAVGSSSLSSNTTGSGNTVIGFSAGSSNTTGTNNTFLGLSTGINNVDGSFNVFLGSLTAANFTSGEGNTFVGQNSGNSISDNSPLSNATNSVFLGAAIKANGNDETNQIVIGHNAIGQGSNTVTIGNSSITLNRFFGTMRIGTINNGAGDFITTDANGVLTKRTSGQVLSDIGAAPSVAGGYLPLSGGTLTGALNGTSASFSGDLTSNGELRVLNNTGLTFLQLNNTSSGGRSFTLISSGASNPHGIAAGNFYLRNSTLGTNPLFIDGNTGAATFSSALNGTSASFTSSIASGTKFVSTAGNNNIVFESLSATTGYQYLQLLNNTAHTIFGIEGTTAGSLITGGSANASVLTTVGNTNLEFGTNQVKRLTIAASTGAATFSSSINAATGSNFVGTSVNSRILVTATGVANTVVGFNNSGSTVNGVINNAGYIGILQDYPFIITVGDIERFRIASTGAATFSSSVTANGVLNDWGLSIFGNTTTGQSYGGIVRGGTNSSDIAFEVNNAANNTTYFRVRGDGAATFSSSVTATSASIGYTSAAPTNGMIVQGNVGIGTTSPSQLLHLETTLAGSSGVGTALQITSGGAGGDQAWIGVNKGTGNGLEFSITNRDFIFNTGATTPFGGTERMRITSDGRIQIALAGIPTSDPNIEGQLYRNSSGQLFISLGVV